MSVNKNRFTIEDINKLAREKPVEFMKEQDKNFYDYVIAAADIIAGKPFGHKIVMLTGPSGSGKTTTSLMLKELLSKRGIGAPVISLDNFFLPKRLSPKLPDGSHDYESIYALDIDNINRSIELLIKEGQCEIPRFDFVKGEPSGESHTLKLGENDAVIIESIHALNPVFTQRIFSENLVKIYISIENGLYNDIGKEIFTEHSLRFLRRMVRDYKYRGSEPSKTFAIWEQTRKGEEIYTKPFANKVDIKINSLHYYEPCIISGFAIELLKMVPKSSNYYHEAQQLIEHLSEIAVIPLELLSERSLLREFVGGGIYSY